MEVIDNWIAEFIIRRQHNPRVSPTNLLSALQLGDSPDCLKLKVSSVLRDISNSLIRGTLDEGTLDLLEILEKLLLQQQSLLMECHKSAYCWTAAECTLKFMWPLSASDGFFTDALERIWARRIGVLKDSGSDLVTQDLLKWETDLKKALEDPEIYNRIRETNIRYTAISFLTQLLKEQWALLGSSSLESLAQRSFLKRKTDNVVNRGDPNAVDESMMSSESDIIVDVNQQRGTSEREERNGNHRENASVVEGVACVENEGVNMVNEQHSSNEEQMGVQEQERGVDKVNVQHETGEEQITGAQEQEHGIDKVNVQHETNGEQTVGEQEQEHEPSLDKGDKTVARELKDYLLEIQRHIDSSTRQGQESHIGSDHSIDVTPQPAQVNRNGTGSQDQNVAPQQVNLNEKGSDSQGTSSCGRVRPRLPSPISLNVSPLKKSRVANPQVRRPKKFWTPEEVEALREGVKEFGKSWKDIKNANPAVFAERTEVDLKDKWRNLVSR